MTETRKASRKRNHYAVKLLIEGRVQGVWYRGWTAENARRLGLDGWVQNRRDGSVQAVFSGPVGKVQEMVRLCKQGPPAAEVTSINAVGHGESVPQGFTVRRTV